MKRIYREYGIRVTTDEGMKMVKLNKNVDMTSHSVARDQYNKTKARYIDKGMNVTIELIGIKDDGSLGNMIYKKAFINEIEEENRELLKRADDIVEDIKKSIELLMKKKQYHKGMIMTMDKKEDISLHNFENLSEDDDLGMLKESRVLKRIRNERRIHKTERKKINALDDVLDIKKIHKLFKELDLDLDKKEHKVLNKRDLAEKKIMREVKYSNSKDKKRKMKALEKDYERIVDNPISRTLICYVRGYRGE